MKPKNAELNDCHFTTLEPITCKWCGAIDIKKFSVFPVAPVSCLTVAVLKSFYFLRHNSTTLHSNFVEHAGHRQRIDGNNLEGSLTNEVGGSTSLGLVVFDAKTGVRYADMALTASNTVSAASATAESVRAAVAKSRRSPEDLHTVGLLLVRNADMPRQFDGLCDAVGLLLERELTASPGIAVLERRRLEQVTKERSVAPDAEGNRLLTSLRMIELDISRDGDGLRGTLALAGADGARSEAITASIPTRDAASLAHLLADKTERFLKAPSDILPPNRAAEAARFHREYLQLRVQSDYTAAVRSLDAALALDPEQTKWQEEMAQLLPSAAIESSGDLATCLALAQRGADLMLNLARKAAQDFKPGEPIPGVLQDANHYTLDSLRQRLAAITKTNTVGTAELAALAGKVRTLRMEIMEPFLTKQSVDKTSFAIYDQMIRGWINPFASTEDTRQDDLLVVRHWIELSHRINPPDGSGLYTPLDSYFAGFFWHFRGNEAEDFRKSLEQDQDPIIRLYARAGRLSSSMKLGNQPSGESLAIEREFRLYAQDLLAHGEAAKPGPYRNQVWKAIQTGIVLCLGNPDCWKECLDSCRFALAQEDIQPDLFYSAIFAFNNPRQRMPSEELEVVNGALKLILDKPEPYPGSNVTFRGRDAVIKDLRQRSGQLAADLAVVNTNEPAPSPWKQKDCLLDLAKPIDGHAWLFKPIVQDGQVFALALGIHEWGLPEDSLQLVRVPLKSGPPVFLGQGEDHRIRMAGAQHYLEPRSSDSAERKRDSSRCRTRRLFRRRLLLCGDLFRHLYISDERWPRSASGHDQRFALRGYPCGCLPGRQTLLGRGRFRAQRLSCLLRVGHTQDQHSRLQPPQRAPFPV